MFVASGPKLRKRGQPAPEIVLVELSPGETLLPSGRFEQVCLDLILFTSVHVPVVVQWATEQYHYDDGRLA